MGSHWIIASFSAQGYELFYDHSGCCIENRLCGGSAGEKQEDLLGDYWSNPGGRWWWLVLEW